MPRATGGLTPGQILGGQILGDISNLAGQIANGTVSDSTSQGTSWGSSWGSSASSSFNNLDAYSILKSMGESKQGGESSSWQNSSSRTFGREASAQDIQNAAEANQIQRDLWSMQADYNAKEAQKNRDYQERLSNTAYQRAVRDLLAAGLNPILAVGNMGATTPVGATANTGLASAHKANAFAESESSSAGGSQSSNWGWSKSKTNSKSKTTGRGASESHSSEGSSSGSQQSSESHTRTQLADALSDITGSTNSAMESAKEAIEGVKDLFTNPTSGRKVDEDRYDESTRRKIEGAKKPRK